MAQFKDRVVVVFGGTGSIGSEIMKAFKKVGAVVYSAYFSTRKAAADAMILENLDKCKLVVDNVEEIWKRIDFSARGIEHHVGGDRGWLGG